MNTAPHKSFQFALLTHLLIRADEGTNVFAGSAESAFA